MDPFSSPPPSGSRSGISNEMMMDQVKQQMAQAYAEEFFSVGISRTSARFCSPYFPPHSVRPLYVLKTFRRQANLNHVVISSSAGN